MRRQWALLVLICSTAPRGHGQCVGGQTFKLTTSNATISSNSYGTTYPNNANCSWVIMPSGARWITLSFALFDTESHRDYVRIYSCSDLACSSKTQLGNSPYSGYAIPESVTVILSGIMRIEFRSNANITRRGFVAIYTSSTSDSTCPTGKYSTGLGGCNSCLNKPYKSYYTSGSEDCSWTCNLGYFERDGYCYLSSGGSCDVGDYSGSAAGSCYPCKNLPYNAYYISNGGSSPTGCSWTCTDKYYSNGYICTYGPPSKYDWLRDPLSPIFKAVAGGAGAALLLAIVVIAIALRAKYSTEVSTVAEERLKHACCTCASSFSARRAVHIACGVLAVPTLALAVASDSIPCDPASFYTQYPSSDPPRKLALAAAAFGLQLVGGAIMYCFSACGCSLCCVCAPGACDRTAQATSAIAVSVLMWWIAASVFGWIVSFLSIELATDYSYRYSYRENRPCFETFTYIPTGLTSIAGILSAASLVLHGHFVTLVPEALHNLHRPRPDGPGPAQALPPSQVQPPQAVNSQQAAKPIDLHPAVADSAVAAESVVFRVAVAPPADAPPAAAVPAVAGV